jgi:predicted amidohydrolase
MPDSAPYLAAVVQAAIVWPDARMELAEVQALHAARMVTMMEALDQVVSPSPRVYVFPVTPLEGLLTSEGRLPPGGLDQLAVDLRETATTGSFAPVADACRRLDCYVAGSAVEALPEFAGRFFHTGFILGPEGLVLRAPKVQALSWDPVIPVREIWDEYFAVAGPEGVFPVVETPIGRLACAIESEIELPEVGRMLRSKGAVVVLNPTYHFDASTRPEVDLRRTMAYTNSCYVLSACRGRDVYGDTETLTQGVSTIYGPDGDLLTSLGPSGEGVAVAWIDPSRPPASLDANGRRTQAATAVFGR